MSRAVEPLGWPRERVRATMTELEREGIIPLRKWRPTINVYFQEMQILNLLQVAIVPLGVLIGHLLKNLMLGTLVATAIYVLLSGASTAYFGLKALKSAYVLSYGEFCFYEWGLLKSRLLRIPLDEVEGVEFGLGKDGYRLYLRLREGRIFALLPKAKAFEVEAALREMVLERARQFSLSTGRVERRALEALAGFLEGSEKVFLALPVARRPAEFICVTDRRLVMSRRRGRRGFVRWHKLEAIGRLGRADFKRWKGLLFSSEWESFFWRYGPATRRPEPSPAWKYGVERRPAVVGRSPFGRLWVPGAPIFVPEEAEILSLLGGVAALPAPSGL